MQALIAQHFSALTLAQKRQARRAVRVNAERPYGVWYPNVEPPEWLDGSMPGDFGFDPFGIGSDVERLPWFQQAELINGRWSMLAVAGIMAAEILNPDADKFGERWFEVGAKPQPYPLLPLLAIELGIFASVENIRLQEYKKGNTTLFDPFNMGSNDAMKVREVKNARLAMIALIGFWVQSVITLEGPIAGLKLHMADPLNYNITYNVPHILDNVLKYYPDQPMIKIYEAYESNAGAA